MTPKQLAFLAILFLLAMGVSIALVILIPAFILVIMFAGATGIAMLRRRVMTEEELHYEYQLR